MANVLRSAELEVLKGKRHGRLYRKPFSKRRYRASAPEEAPARRTGALRLHWTKGVAEGIGSRNGKNEVGIVAYLESDTPYSGILEKGSEKIEPRPYVEKIKEKAKPEIESIMKQSYE